MTNIIYRYLMVVVACISLLIGLQIPNFVDQYQKRIDARLREVTINLQPFQEIANKYFGGDIGKLIELTVDRYDEGRVRAMCDKLLANPVIEDYRIEPLPELAAAKPS